MEDRISEYYGIDLDTHRAPQGLSAETLARLYPYQRGHTAELGVILSERGLALDRSATGTGKSYPAAALARDLGAQLVVVCPKSMLCVWEDVCRQMEVTPLAIVNYETLRTGKVYQDGRRVWAPWLQVRGTDITRYHWQLPASALVVFDEAHLCRNPQTDHAALLAGACRSPAKVLCLSATLSETEADLQMLLYLTGEIRHPREWRRYLRRQGDQPVLRCRERLRQWSSAMSREEAMAGLPDNHRQVVVCQSRRAARLADDYQRIVQAGSQIGEWTRHRRAIERAKLPFLLEMAEHALEAGQSVVIFLNYLESIARLAADLDVRAIIQGDTTAERRARVIRHFARDRVPVVICQIETGGVGISLHDVRGQRPRVALFSPPLRASVLIQALGRVYRAGVRTPVVQKMVYLADVPYERRLAEIMRGRLEHLAQMGEQSDLAEVAVTDADLCPAEFRE